MIKETGAESPSIDSPFTNKSKGPFNFLGAPGIKRQNTMYIKQMKEEGILPRSQSGKPGEVKKCIEQLNKSFGPSQESRSDEGKFENQNDENNPEGAEENEEPRKKSFVARFLDKQNIRYIDSPSRDSDDIPKRTKVPKLDLTPKKRRSDVNALTKLDINVHYYSDPQKSDNESEQSSVDSKQSEDSKQTESSLPPFYPLKLFESSGGSDGLQPQNNDMSMSSVKSSPNDSTIKTFTHKKSKFYNENVFTFGVNAGKAFAEDESQKIDPTQLYPHKSSGMIDPNRTVALKENNELRSRILKSNARLQALAIPGEKKENSAPNQISSLKLTEDMLKLRGEMNRKKDTIKIYEVIARQGKAIMNREPYKWSKSFNVN